MLLLGFGSRFCGTPHLLLSVASGIAAILVHALNDRARAFYPTADFDETTAEPMTLYARIKDISALMGAA